MRFDGPPPGGEINDGNITVPRAAASVIVLRDSSDGPEVLMVRRSPEQRFMGGVWVFPGGAVDPAEDGDPALAGVRELHEEASIDVGGTGDLIPFVRWITPEEVTTRFDTWFFLVRAPDGQEGVCDGSECVDLRWITATGALDAHERDEFTLVFPTIRTLQRLAAFDSVEQALDTARTTDTDSILPRVIVREDHSEVVLPGEPGYDD